MVSGIEADVRTVVVLTALPVEYRAVRAGLVSVRRGPRVQGTVTEEGWLNGTPWKVVLAQLGEGNHGAAALTERIVQAFGPYALFLVGVAGGLKPDLALGDVVVGTKVYQYHGGKETAAGFAARPEAWPAHHELVQLARLVDVSGEWARKLPRTSAGRPAAVHFKPIAAGEVLLDAEYAENGETSPVRQRLGLHYQDAAAIEMEGAGVAHAGHLNDGLRTLVVRGISDRADGGKKRSDDDNWQAVAARNAAALAFSVIRELRHDDGTPAEAPAPVLPAQRIVTYRSETPSPRSLPPADAPAAPWGSGQEFLTRECRYLLHGERNGERNDEQNGERAAPDHSLIQRAAVARRLEPATGMSGSPFVWLRQTEVRFGTPDALAALTALRREHDLLGRLHRRSRGLPAQGRFETIGNRRAVLALPWPASRKGDPCPTLHTTWAANRPTPLRRTDLVDLLHRVAGLYDVLDVLHRSGVAHRCLTPSGVIELDDGRLVLRDLGLAGHDPRPGEGPPPYRAPEQWLGHPPGLIGPATDVYQLAALTYRLATGHPPESRAPLPLRARLGPVPDSLERALHTALDQDPGGRPGARETGRALRSAREDLLGDV
ncbi:hypothetical protein [Streptomyces sp. NPDC096132]|uniref:phosphorylase family protein n=1 Tax=Streptomyces sp. NPDC096132 TaxID=3366075 RepID=UPI0037F1B9B8